MNQLARPIAAITVLVVSSVGLADPLNLVRTPPDIMAGYVTVTYDKDSSLLSLSGFPLTFTPDGIQSFAFDFASNLSFQINSTVTTGGVATDGRLTITGDVTVNGQLYSGTLVSGKLESFGYTPPGEGALILEFLFTSTGGSMSNYFNGSRGPIGVMADANFPAFEGFGASFANQEYAGVADVYQTPSPPAFLLGLLGLGSMVVYRRVSLVRFWKRGASA